MSYERSNIHRMHGYEAGEQPDDALTIKLNTNENPYPPSPGVGRALDEIQVEALRRYPPTTANRFRDAAAELHSLKRDNIIATRGGDELLRLVITTFVEPGEVIGMTDPTYSLYPILAQIQNCPVHKIPLEEDWSLPSGFATDMNARGAKLTLLVNPHAPSGALLGLEELSQLATDLDSLLLLDEAYIDFVDHPSETTQLVESHDNVIILRTLSKGYSLAGLRFGYGLGATSLISPMVKKTRDSYNLDLISQQIAEAALKDQAYAHECWQKVIAERSRLAAVLSEMGLHSPPSQANFLLIDVPETTGCSAIQLYQKLKEKNILVRYFDTPRLSGSVRISVGSELENLALATAIREILGARL